MWLRYIVMRPPFAALARTKKYRLKVEGSDSVPRYGPFIVVANHQSSTDIVAIALALKNALVRSHMWPWAKVEIQKGREGPLGRILWNIFGVIPIDREAGQSEETIRSSLEYLQRGEIICVFPEGTRYKNKELGWFEYGVANLARAAPAPILPVGIYRREGDGGIQVNVGRPFFMPPIKARYERLEALEDRVEERVGQQIDALKQWSAVAPRDKKGMRMIANMINMVVDLLGRQEISFDRFCRMAESEDNEFIRDRVLELLPEGWSKVEEEKKEKKERDKRSSSRTENDDGND
ncbi:MAG: 1-acyl-sn-glycerol-3-phosphate acyltransferase [Actinobacteria bacterium]|nr:1-acyl-sn-glycerol-3-phosphate acyltransferase [Actinomycetota bacterium]